MAVIASTLDLPPLAEAARERGLDVLRLQRDALPDALAEPGIAAAVLGWQREEGDPARLIATLRAGGWCGPLLLAFGMGGGDIADALDAGADDAVILPASGREIAARVAARLRARPAMIDIGDLRIETVARTVTRAGRPIMLLPREYALLLDLARHAGSCVSRAELLRRVWGLGFDPGTNVVQVHVSRLRAKLDGGAEAPMLRTHKGRGYCLAPPGH